MSRATTLRPRSDALYQSHADGSGHDVTWPEFLAWAADPKRVHIVSVMERPGVLGFLEALEARLFPSDSILESAYTCHSVIWIDLPWNIASVPVWALGDLETLAREFGLVIRHTVPLVIEEASRILIASLAIGKSAGPGAQWFPLRLPNVYTIENRPPNPNQDQPPGDAWG
jgi:hypothetical protein